MLFDNELDRDISFQVQERVKKLKKVRKNLKEINEKKKKIQNRNL